jgi:hypothetical protein
MGGVAIRGGFSCQAAEPEVRKDRAGREAVPQAPPRMGTGQPSQFNLKLSHMFPPPLHFN